MSSRPHTDRPWLLDLATPQRGNAQSNERDVDADYVVRVAAAAYVSSA